MSARWQFHPADLSASLVVFLVALPLCMGVAIASGMPPSAGLITGIVGGVIVGAISGSPLQVSGPAAGLTVLVWNLVEQHGVQTLGVIVLLAGVLQALAGLSGFGRYFRAISPAVVYGMLAGIGVLICASQLHMMIDAKPLKSGIANMLAFPGALQNLSSQGGQREAALVGVLTIGLMLLWQRFRPHALRMLPAPLIGVLGASTYAAVSRARVHFIEVPDALWSALKFPELSALGQGQALSLGVAALTLALIASAETLLCAAAVDRLQDKVRTDYDRELFAQGVGNFFCGLLGGLPLTGVIVRSSANVQAGAQTRLSAILHGAFILALVALAPSVLRLVPTASLAAVLVHTGVKLVSPSHMRELRDFGWGSLGIYAATLLGVVLSDLLQGVLLGLGLSLLRLLWKLVNFEIDVRAHADASRVDVYMRGAATFLGLPHMAAILERLPHVREIHLHIEELSFIDHACLVALGDYERLRSKLGARVVIDWDNLDARSEKVGDLQPSA